MNDERLVALAREACAELLKHERTLLRCDCTVKGNTLKTQSRAVVFDATVTTTDDATPLPVEFRFFVEQLWEGTRKLVIETAHTTASFDSDHNVVRFEVATESLLRHFVRTFTPRIASIELLRASLVNS